jgi:hypothetical protein
MTRQLPWLRLVLGALCLVSMGCETHRSWLRPKDDDDIKVGSSEAKAVDSDASKILGVESDEKKSEPFFKNNRRSGAWSSEAREIEKDLGVN